MVRGILLILVSLLASGAIRAQQSDTSTGIFSPRFKTLKTGVAGNFMSLPVIRMNSNDKIVVSFDEIGEDNSYLQYRLIHCNADWQPSRLVESEYIDGFNNIDIDDYAFSSNTFVHYVNYRIEIPSPVAPLLASGNYLLQVFDPDEPDETLIQTRFSVSENIIPVAASVSLRTDRGVNNGWQQLSVLVDREGFDTGNPYSDISLEIVQNLDFSSSRRLRNPIRTDKDRLAYEHAPELVFPAGNEYRRFETVSTAFPGMNVDSVKYIEPVYNFWVKQDEERADRNYSFDRTQHGRFLVREYNATDSDVGADYVMVNFSLDFPEAASKDIYVDGEMTHGKFNDFNRMRYDKESGLYKLAMPLKQGAYNYRYVMLPRNNPATSRPDPTPVEGNKSETGNEYTVYVWFHPPGARADRLLSVAVVNFN